MLDLKESRIPKRPNLRKEVYQVLRSYLVKMSADSPLPAHFQESEIARMLGVSRTPVREALNRLAQEGMIEIVPYRGIIMTPVSMSEYLDWLHVRERLEGLAAECAALAMTTKDVKHLRTIFKQFNKSNLSKKPREYAEANARFHMRIVEASENSVVQRIMTQYDYMKITHMRMIERVDRAAASLDEHHAIIDAISDHDPDSAGNLARQHIQELRHDVLAYLNPHNPAAPTKAGALASRGGSNNQGSEHEDR